MKLKDKKAGFRVLVTLVMTAALLFSNTGDASADTVVTRLSGPTRFQTAVETSKNGWSGGSGAVVIVNGMNFPDALSAAPLAKKYNAPILLSGASSLDSSTYGEIKRLGAKTAYIVGGTGVVPAYVETQLREIGITNIERFGGSDRYETSVKVAERIGVGNGVVVAAGLSYADSLSIAPVAAKLQMPILLTPKDYTSQYTRNFINKYGTTKSYIIGGTGVISNEAVSVFGSNTERLGGADRYETNIKVIERFKSQLNVNKLYVASGSNFPDGLVAAPIAAMNGAPVVLATDSNKTYLDKTIKGVSGFKTDSLYVLGGSAVVSDNLVSQIVSVLNPTFKVEGIE